MSDRFVWKWLQCVSERARIQHIGISQRFGVLLSVPLAFGKLVSTLLNTLWLSNNNIGDDGAKAIAEALKVNPVLKTPNLVAS